MDRTFYVCLLGIVCLGLGSVKGVAQIGQVIPHTVDRLQKGLPVKIAGFGDSISTSYGNVDHTGYHRISPEQLYYGVFAHFLRSSYPKAEVSVYNAGVGGNVAGQGLARIEKSVLLLAPDLVFVMFGTNDAGGSLAMYERDLNQIVETLRTRLPDADIVLVGPPPGLIRLGGALPCNVIMNRIAERHKLHFFDAFRALAPISAGWKRSQTIEQLFQYYGGIYPFGDGTHPNLQGHYILGRSIFRAVQGKPFPTSPLELSLKHEYGSGSDFRLTWKNRSQSPVTAQLQVILPTTGLESPDATVIPVEATNGLRTQLQVLPRKQIELQPGEEGSVTWSLPFSSDTPSWALKQRDLRRSIPVVLYFDEGRGCIVDYAPLPPSSISESVIKQAVLTGGDGSAVWLAPDQPTEVNLEVGTAFSDARGGGIEVRYFGKSIFAPAGSDGTVRLSLPIEKRGGVDNQTMMLIARQGDRTGPIMEVRPAILQIVPDTVISDSLKRRAWQKITTSVGNLREYRDKNARFEARFSALRSPDATEFEWRLKDPLLYAGKLPWRNSDGVELLVENNGAPRQFGFFLPEDLKQGALRIEKGVGVSKDEEISGIRAEWRRDSGGYTIQARIPDSLLMPQERQKGVMRYSTFVNDSDGGERIQFVWAGSFTNYESSRQYGRMVFDRRAPRGTSVNLLFADPARD